ncbi:MAG TPA: RibD family protein [Polyangiaceae bacterium]|nr:RibD family protein [Polyangiaceae bacterium]
MAVRLVAPRSKITFDEDAAWSSLVALARGRSAPALAVELGDDGAPALRSRHEMTEGARAMLELFAPLACGDVASDFVVAHLGQSLDGRIAVPDGTTRFITGPEDIRHTHRLRALADAVVVGASTTDLDDPELTTRHVSGDDPVRVVLDPRGRVPRDRRVFNDGKAPTILVTTESARRVPVPADVDVLVVSPDPARFSARRVRDALRARGLERLLVEGGGVTVSRFIEDGVVDVVQIAVAPKLIGTGAPALVLSAVCAPPTRVRRFVLGEDVLFEYALERRAPESGA